MKRYIIIFMLMLSYIGFAEEDSTQVAVQDNAQLPNSSSSIEGDKALSQEDFNNIKRDYQDLERKYSFVLEQIKAQNDLNKDKFSALEKSIDKTNSNNSNNDKLKELEDEVNKINTVNTFNDKEHERLEGFYKDYMDKIFADNNRTLIWVGIIVGSFTVIITILAGVLGVLVPYFMNKRSKKRLRDIETNAKEEIDDLKIKIEESEANAKKAAKEANSNLLFLMAQNEKEYDKAMEYCNQAIKLITTAKSYFYKGYVNSNFKKNNEAILDYSEAININPNYSEAYNNRGVAKYNLENYEDAMSDYNKSIEINSNYAEAYNNRGIAKSKLGNYKSAMSDCDEAIKMNSNYAEAYNSRGNIKSTLGNKRGAILDYNEAIRLNPNFSEIYQNRGNAKSDLGDNRGAILDYNEAIRLNPNYPRAYYNRGFAKSDLGNYEGAMSDYNEAIRINPNYSLAYNSRGNAKSYRGDNAGAILDYSESIRLNPNYYAYSNRGSSNYNLNKHELALRDLNKAVELGSNLLNTYKYRALTFRALEKKESDSIKKAEYIKSAEIDEKKVNDLKDKNDSQDNLNRNKDNEQRDKEV